MRFAPHAISQYRRILAWLLLAMWGSIPSAALAAVDAGAKMSFDLPADDAERSLKRFASQSGLEVLFGSEPVARVRTTAVKGEHTPRDAMNRMLAGTNLTATHDAKTGAITITTASPPPGPSNGTAPAGADLKKKP